MFADPERKQKWGLSKPIILVHFILRESIRAHNTFNVVKPSRVINGNHTFAEGRTFSMSPVPVKARFRPLTKAEKNTKNHWVCFYHLCLITISFHTVTGDVLMVKHVYHKTIKHGNRCFRCEWLNLFWDYIRLRKYSLPLKFKYRIKYRIAPRKRTSIESFEKPRLIFYWTVYLV